MYTAIQVCPEHKVRAKNYAVTLSLTTVKCRFCLGHTPSGCFKPSPFAFVVSGYTYEYFVETIDGCI